MIAALMKYRVAIGGAVALSALLGGGLLWLKGERREAAHEERIQIERNSRMAEDALRRAANQIESRHDEIENDFANDGRDGLHDSLREGQFFLGPSSGAIAPDSERPSSAGQALRQGNSNSAPE